MSKNNNEKKKRNKKVFCMLMQEDRITEERRKPLVTFGAFGVSKVLLLKEAKKGKKRLVGKEWLIERRRRFNTLAKRKKHEKASTIS